MILNYAMMCHLLVGVLWPVVVEVVVIVRCDRRRRSLLKDSRKDFFNDLPRDKVPSFIMLPPPSSQEKTSKLYYVSKHKFLYDYDK